MRRIILFISLVTGLSAEAQTITQSLGGPNTLVKVNGFLEIDSVLSIPKDTIALTPARKLFPLIAAKGDSLYRWSTAQNKYVFIGSGSAVTWGSITGTLSTQTDLQAALDAKQNEISLGTTAQYFRGDLSLSTFSSDVTTIGDANYANITHTHSGLLPIGGTTGQIIKKNSSSDYDYSWQDEGVGYVASTRQINTGYGLSGGGDLSINRTHIVDSATLSNYYLRRKDSSTNGGYYPYATNPKSYLVAADIAGKLNIADSTSYATFLRLYKVRDSLAAAYTAAIALTLKYSDTAAMKLQRDSDTLVWDATKTDVANAIAGLGSPNSNIGSGYSWAVPWTNNIKTLFNGYSVLIDSSSNTNGLTLKVDTANISTKAYAQSLVDGISVTASKFGKSGEDATAAENRLFNRGTNSFQINGTITDGDDSFLLSESTGLFYHRGGDFINRSTISAKENVLISASSPADGETFLEIKRDSAIFDVDINTSLNLLLKGLPSATTANVLYYDATTKQVTYGAAPSGSSYTDEEAQDAIGAMVNSTLTYTDATPLLGINLGNANTWTADQSVPDEAYGVGWDASTEVPTKNAIYDKIETISAGYTNLTSFVAQNNWKVFYSDGSGDVQELALGASGTALKSNGTTAAPSFSAVGDAILASNQTFTGVNTFSNYLSLTEMSAPATPSAGAGRFYGGTDKKPHYLNSDGTNYDLTAAALTSGYVGFGSSGTLAGSSNLQFNDVSVRLTVNGVLQASKLDVVEVSSQTTPATGYGRYWVKDDGTPWFTNDAGTATQLTGGGGGITQENSEDYTGALFATDNGDIDFTYNDATPDIGAEIKAGAIVNADINASAAIAYSKLNLTGAILNADLAGSIALSKLSITGTPDGTKFLRDDGSWVTPSGSGSNWTVTGSDLYRDSKVMIGTTDAPSAKLHVKSTADADVWIQSAGGSANYAQMVFGNGTIATGNYASFERFADDGDFFVANLNKRVIFTTSYSSGYREDLVVTTAGNVAMGGELAVATNLSVGGPISSPEMATPSTPGAGRAYIYPKSDGFWYGIDDAGTETKLSNEAGGATAFASLTDVSLTSIATNDFLKWDGTDWINRTPANVRADLGLVIGTNVQAYDADLTTYAGITPSANVQSLLGAADFAAFKTLLGTNNVDNTSDATKNSATATLTNKRITARTGTTTSSATPTINTDNVDEYYITAQTVDITSFTTNLSGTPTDGQRLCICITGTASRAITWGASFESSSIALPTTTSGTSMLTCVFKWNASKWRLAGYY